MSNLELNELFAVLFGFLIRLGIPILLTLLAAWGLRKVDQRWQRESEHIRAAPLGLGAAAAEVRCWEQTDCPEEKRHACPAYAQPSVPCWQVFRERSGILPTSCLSCAVFLNAPARS